MDFPSPVQLVETGALELVASMAVDAKDFLLNTPLFREAMAKAKSLGVDMELSNYVDAISSRDDPMPFIDVVRRNPHAFEDKKFTKAVLAQLEHTPLEIDALKLHHVFSRSMSQSVGGNAKVLLKIYDKNPSIPHPTPFELMKFGYIEMLSSFAMFSDPEFETPPFREALAEAQKQGAEVEAKLKSMVVERRMEYEAELAEKRAKRRGTRMNTTGRV
jgi:hypothetical protein